MLKRFVFFSPFVRSVGEWHNDLSFFFLIHDAILRPTAPFSFMNFLLRLKKTCGLLPYVKRLRQRSDEGQVQHLKNLKPVCSIPAGMRGRRRRRAKD